MSGFVFLDGLPYVRRLPDRWCPECSDMGWLWPTGDECPCMTGALPLVPLPPGINDGEAR